MVKEPGKLVVVVTGGVVVGMMVTISRGSNQRFMKIKVGLLRWIKERVRIKARRERSDGCNMKNLGNTFVVLLLFYVEMMRAK